MSVGPKLETVARPCKYCGAKVTVSVWPGEGSSLRGAFVCPRCRQLKREGGYVAGGKELTEAVNRLCESVAANLNASVTTYRPGDDGFDEIAAKCTPPRNIKSRHGMNCHFRGGKEG